MLQCVLQCDDVCCRVACSVLTCVAACFVVCCRVCCSVLLGVQGAADCSKFIEFFSVSLQRIAQCVAVQASVCVSNREVESVCVNMAIFFDISIMQQYICTYVYTCTHV